MSQETLEWLNSNVLVGFSEKRGRAWWANKAATNPETGESNHYIGPIPIPDILRRLFNFRAEVIPVYVEVPATSDTATHIGRNGQPARFVEVPNKGAVAAVDNWDVFHIHSESYNPHQYDEWLLDNVANLLQKGDIEVGAAGMLENRAIAWASIEMPETVKTTAGVEFRPNLLATTSMNGKCPSIYKLVETLTVCDNTRQAALSEKGGVLLKVRHTKNSFFDLTKASQAIEVLETEAAAFSAEVDTLTSWRVTESDWDKVLKVLVPDKESKAGQTRADSKRDELDTLYKRDARSATWTGTAFGVLQAFNTWDTHFMGTKSGTVRAERNMLDAILGNQDKRDMSVLKTLVGVTGVNPLIPA